MNEEHRRLGANFALLLWSFVGVSECKWREQACLCVYYEYGGDCVQFGLVWNSSFGLDMKTVTHNNNDDDDGNMRDHERPISCYLNGLTSQFKINLRNVID